jgi:hypothetical protein
MDCSARRRNGDFALIRARRYQCNDAKLPGSLTSFSTLEKMSSFMAALSLIKSRLTLTMHATRVTLPEERGYDPLSERLR